MPVINQPTTVTVVVNQSTSRVIVPGPTTIITAGIQGPPGPPGPSGSGTLLTANAGISLVPFQLVVMIGGLLYLADPTDAGQAGLFAGMTVTAGAMGHPVNYAPLGEVDGMSGLSLTRYYLGLNGTLSTMVKAPGAAWQKVLGYAKTSSSFILLPGPSILL